MEKSSINILTGDIGGTNCRIQLFENGQAEMPIFEKKYKTKEFDKIEALFEKFGQECPQFDPKKTYAAISLASKIVNNRMISSANYSWEWADGNEIKEKYGFLDFQFLNDFEACGYTILDLKPEDLVPLRKEHPVLDNKFTKTELKRYAVIGPGTGLGVCSAFSINGKLKVLSSEGGHVGAFAFNDEIYEIQQFIKEHNAIGEDEILSSELIFCGKGIPLIYRFLLKKAGKEDKPEIKGEDVSSLINEGSDPEALRTLEIFLQCLGGVMQHLSAVLCPENGIILSGTILNSVRDKLTQDVSEESSSNLLKIFFKNKSLDCFLKSIPIFLCKKEELGLSGCKNFAIQNLDQ